jgi:hypothetical protein
MAFVTHSSLDYLRRHALGAAALACSILALAGAG